MRVLLINPSRANEITADNPSFIDEERGFNPPLGLLYLAGYLRSKKNCEVFALDAQAERFDYDDRFRNRIKAIDPDVVGITAMTFTMIDVLKTIEVVKSVNPKISVVLGGPHVHLFPRETISLNGVDYAIKGEGEVPFYHLVESLQGRGSLSDIDGLVYMKEGKIVENDSGDLIDDLDGLPFPDRKILPIEKYSSVLGGNSIVTTMFTSRGCPFQCTFCDRPHMGKRFRSRSAKNVVDEMEECASMGIKEILVYDDTFTVDRQRALSVCDEIQKRNLKINWDIRARVDTVDREVLERLKKSGCQRIHFGVEAGSEKILRKLGKGIDLDQIFQAFEDAKDMGMETLAYFMIGSPEETEEDVRSTMRLARKLNPSYVHITILTPYPGTKIYQDALASGVIETDYWRDFARDPLEGVRVRYWEKELSREKLFALLDEFYKSFYGRPSYIFKKLLTIRSLGDLMKKAKMGFKILK